MLHLLTLYTTCRRCQCGLWGNQASAATPTPRLRGAWHPQRRILGTGPGRVLWGGQQSHWELPSSTAGCQLRTEPQAPRAARTQQLQLRLQSQGPRKAVGTSWRAGRGKWTKSSAVCRGDGTTAALSTTWKSGRHLLNEQPNSLSPAPEGPFLLGSLAAALPRRRAFPRRAALRRVAAAASRGLWVLYPALSQPRGTLDPPQTPTSRGAGLHKGAEPHLLGLERATGTKRLAGAAALATPLAWPPRASGDLPRTPPRPLAALQPADGAQSGKRKKTNPNQARSGLGFPGGYCRSPPQPTAPDPGRANRGAPALADAARPNPRPGACAAAPGPAAGGCAGGWRPTALQGPP